MIWFVKAIQYWHRVSTPSYICYNFPAIYARCFITFTAKWATPDFSFKFYINVIEIDKARKR